MRIEVRAQGFPLTDALAAYTERAIDKALGRFYGRLTQVSAKLVDQNGPRGGVDKRCQLEVVAARQEPLLVEAQHADLYAAIDVAADRASRLVSREVERKRIRRQRASQHREAERTGLMVRRATAH
ncbi:MAG: HPF/RaiA family ribosome-associated protein [Vicinamibacteraceae bacterium]|nr:HPF/RaiA family ribosome-associated protein [Vicinamibacteraceae bacterium]